MFKRKSKSERVELAGTAFGVGVRIEADGEDQLTQLAAWLPPAWQPADLDTDANTIQFKLIGTGEDSYVLQRDGLDVGGGSLEDTLRGYEWMLRTHIARSAPAHLFIHAGTVAFQGEAIVIPGLSFSGKTTLVTALVGLGAIYYSDEYAVIDNRGLVHPYPKPLSIRASEGLYGTPHEPERMGAVVGDRPIPIGLVACTQYGAGNQWHPIDLTPGEAMLELMVHAFAGSETASDSMAVLSRAVAGVQALKGDRGDATGVAADLLQRLGRGTTPR